jgi:PAB-dependent poly(A)-specific ribonuclease subunit 3
MLPLQTSLPAESLPNSVEGRVQTQEHDHDPYNPYDFSPWNLDTTGQASLEAFDGAANPFDYDPTLTFPTPAFTYTRQPLVYHLYTAPPPTTFAPTHFVPDNLREELQARSEAVFACPTESNGLPEELQGYHSLVSLENVSGERRMFGNWYSTVYKAVNANDSGAYVLRRVESALERFASFASDGSYS